MIHSNISVIIYIYNTILLQKAVIVCRCLYFLQENIIFFKNRVELNQLRYLFIKINKNGKQVK